jgi:hypothetical protein
MAAVVTPAINCPCVNADWAASTPPGTYPPDVWGSLGPDSGGGDPWTWDYGAETDAGHLAFGEGEVMVNVVDLSNTDQREFLTDQANIGRALRIAVDGSNYALISPITTITDMGDWVVITGGLTNTGVINPTDTLTLTFEDAVPPLNFSATGFIDVANFATVTVTVTGATAEVTGVVVDWGDGSTSPVTGIVDPFFTGQVTHTYTVPGTYHLPVTHNGVAVGFVAPDLVAT